MELIGRHTIRAQRGAVWAALNDAEVLRRCIEGCESLVRLDDNRFEGIVVAAVGPVKARFTGIVTLSDIEPLHGYTISGEGKGGAAGFAKGLAALSLSDEPEGTALDYKVKATVGGKLAQLGARLVDATASKHANTFFIRLKAELEGPAVEGANAFKSDSESSNAVSPAASQLSASWPLLFGLAVAAAIAALVLLSRG